MTIALIDRGVDNSFLYKFESTTSNKPGTNKLYYLVYYYVLYKHIVDVKYV